MIVFVLLCCSQFQSAYSVSSEFGPGFGDNGHFSMSYDARAFFQGEVTCDSKLELLSIMGTLTVGGMSVNVVAAGGEGNHQGEHELVMYAPLFDSTEFEMSQGSFTYGQNFAQDSNGVTILGNKYQIGVGANARIATRQGSVNCSQGEWSTTNPACHLEQELGRCRHIGVAAVNYEFDYVQELSGQVLCSSEGTFVSMGGLPFSIDDASVEVLINAQNPRYGDGHDQAGPSSEGGSLRVNVAPNSNHLHPRQPSNGGVTGNPYIFAQFQQDVPLGNGVFRQEKTPYQFFARCNGNAPKADKIAATLGR